REEAVAETLQMQKVYADFAEEYMAMPVIRGVKTANERFAGAEDTYTIEALMQDGKALQAGTSHFLGQNFAKAFDVKFLSENNQEEYVWATSWGVSTRLVGGLIMTHSDDDGLVLPPKLAPTQVVIVPIPKPSGEIGEVAEKIMRGLKDRGIRVKYDQDTKNRPGFKFAEHELQGVPVRLGLGMRDIENGVVEVARRDTKEKTSVLMDGIVDYVEKLLADIQQNLFQKALDYREEHTTRVDDFDKFKEVLEDKGGFIEAHWDGTTETEKRIKELTKASIRCIPNDVQPEAGKDMLTGEPSKNRVIFAKAY
ncbi:MAG: proline--tRNA ligase, partial [Saprospiraceae bacterium]|nr:proline--tRNA ligase [Saprospiraceae bacterium]